jgi:hypothetical protein
MAGDSEMLFQCLSLTPRLDVDKLGRFVIHRTRAGQPSGKTPEKGVNGGVDS